MIILKILLWVVVIVLVVAVVAVLLVLLAVLGALSVKIQVHFDYDDDGVKLKLKYGVIPIKILPRKKDPYKKERNKARIENVKRTLGPTANKIKNVAQDKIEETKEKKDIEKTLKNAEYYKEEEARIAKEEARIEAELKEAEKELEIATEAEEAGMPLPEVVDESKVSKLDGIKESIERVDFESATNGIQEFLSGFSFDSIIALLAFIGKQTGHTFGKVLRRIIIKQFCVDLTVSGDDAAKTALKVGRISTIAFPALGKMVRSLTVKEYGLEINPDFLAKKDKGELHVKVAVRPIRLLTPFIGYFVKIGGKLISFYRTYKKTKKQKAKVAKAEKAAEKKAAPKAEASVVEEKKPEPAPKQAPQPVEAKPVAKPIQQPVVAEPVAQPVPQPAPQPVVAQPVVAEPVPQPVEKPVEEPKAEKQGALKTTSKKKSSGFDLPWSKGEYN